VQQFGPIRHRRPPTARSLLVLAVMVLVTLGACGGGANPSPTGMVTPPSSPQVSPGQPLPQPTPGEPATPAAQAPWPAGWQEAFCATFSELVVMQELAVDIGRALEEGNRDDARGLTAELDASASSARERLGEHPAWAAADELEQEIVSLIDLADEMALRYDRHLNQGRRPARRLAEEAGAQMGPVVEAVLDRVLLLAEQGLSCPGTEFQLETPPAR
jgi:hypothetical protein